MPRPTTKNSLITQANSNYNKLISLVHNLSDIEVSTSYDFSNNTYKGAHWQRDKNAKDLLTHLYEWHNLMILWVKENLEGKEKTFLPEPYNWKTYGGLNINFWQKHQRTSLADALNILDKSHREIMSLIDNFSNEQLFTKNQYPWVGNTTLGSYFTSTTSSHYEWAIKKIKLHKKNCFDK